MKKILIAIDYDPSAQKVAETGYQLAKAMNASVVLLHVVAEPSYYSSMDYSPIMGFTGFMGVTDPNIPELNEELKRESLRFLEESKAHLGDENIRTVIVEGIFSEAILEVAKNEAADIIVLGTHSRHGLDKLLMGSVAEKVFHHSSIPLFIIPTGEIKK
ncbi:MAG: universal stress protein [Ferruginibacter sp.]